MSTAIEDPVQKGKEAFGKRAWQDAYELLAAADQAQPLTPRDLEDLGEAAWWIGNLEETIDYHERAYNQYLADGNKIRAGFMAVILTRHHFWKNDMSGAMGWKSQAERLLGDAPDSVEKGWLAQLNANVLMEMGAADQAFPYTDETLRLAEQFDDGDLRALGTQDKALAILNLGDVNEGLKFLDEASVLSRAPTVRPLITGVVYCRTITACAGMADWKRAGEITDAANRWCENQSIAGGFPGLCQVHRAEIIRIRGDFAEAEQEATKASERWELSMSSIAADAYNEIGEVRLRRGNLTGAEEAFTKAFELLRTPDPGMALLRLAQGNKEAARREIERALEATTEPLHRAKLLPAQITIAGSDDPAWARKGAEELQTIAERFGTTALKASADCAWGEVLLAEGDAKGALGYLRQSANKWREVNAPYEGAKVRTFMALAYRTTGDEETAVMELKAARSIFERLGAARDLGVIDDLLGGEGGESTGARVTKTFMFTDIVGSTNLVEALGDDAWRDLLAWHDQTLRSLFPRHQGQEVKSVGDGFFIAFERAADAVDCAVAIQRKLADHRKESGFAPQVRIGLHSTEATQKDLDYEGRGVHVAARIGALATGGQILTSSDSIAGGIRYPTSGANSVTLKGIAEPVDVVSIDWQ